jgi:hypothetical protein
MSEDYSGYEFMDVKDIRSESRIYVLNIIRNDAEIAKRMTEAFSSKDGFALFSVGIYLICCANALIPFVIENDEALKSYTARKNKLIARMFELKDKTINNAMSAESTEFLKECIKMHELILSEYSRVGSIVPPEKITDEI